MQVELSGDEIRIVTRIMQFNINLIIWIINNNKGKLL